MSHLLSTSRGSSLAVGNFLLHNSPGSNQGNIHCSTSSANNGERDDDSQRTLKAHPTIPTMPPLEQTEEQQPIRHLCPNDIVIGDDSHPGTIAFRIFVNKYIQSRVENNVVLSPLSYSPIVYSSIMTEWKMEQQGGLGKQPTPPQQQQQQHLPEFFVVESPNDPHDSKVSFSVTVANMKQKIDFVRTCYEYEVQR
jgi:hypothetical protein